MSSGKITLCTACLLVLTVVSGQQISSLSSAQASSQTSTSINEGPSNQIVIPAIIRPMISYDDSSSYSPSPYSSYSQYLPYMVPSLSYGGGYDGDNGISPLLYLLILSGGFGRRGGCGGLLSGLGGFGGGCGGGCGGSCGGGCGGSCGGGCGGNCGCGGCSGGFGYGGGNQNCGGGCGGNCGGGCGGGYGCNGGSNCGCGSCGGNVGGLSYACGGTSGSGSLTYAAPRGNCGCSGGCTSGCNGGCYSNVDPNNSEISLCIN